MLDLHGRIDQVECLHALKHEASTASTTPQPSLEACTSVSWNSSGTVVAAAYGPLDRNDWPRCSSMLCTWSIFRRSLDPSKADVALRGKCAIISEDSGNALTRHGPPPSLFS